MKMVSLRCGEILIHEDFSENFHCKQATEIQSAYYATIGVKLFTVMIYYQKDGDLKHKCCVVVSDSLDHSTDTDVAFYKRVLDYAREIIEVNHVHFVSDGAASQFKNRFTVQNLRRLKADHGATADWSYFETSHGKGAVDGVGGTIKQQVLLSVYRGQSVVNSVKTLVETATKLTEKSKGLMKIILVTAAEIDKNSKLCKERWAMALPAPGIQKAHYICIKDEEACLLEFTPMKVRSQVSEK